jgi:hypothetical protein
MATKKKPVPKKVMPKKTIAKKNVAKKAVPKKMIKKAVAKKTAPIKLIPGRATTRKHKIYIEAAAFFPLKSSDGYVDLFQDGRHAAVNGNSLAAALPLPVGATLLSISLHYMNTTSTSPMCIFARKHADRHSPSGEIEMSFITLPPGSLPPDDYLTVTDTTFADGGIIQDRFLHYVEVLGTGNFEGEGKITIRGMSVLYTY